MCSSTSAHNPPTQQTILSRTMDPIKQEIPQDQLRQVEEGNIYDSCSTSGNSDVDNGTSMNEKKESVIIAKSETRYVITLKVIVLIVLALSALAVSLGMYYYISLSERSQFEKQFGELRLKVVDSIGKSFDGILEALDDYVVNLVSTAQATNQTWPYVVNPDFGIKAAKMLAMSKAAMYFAQHPLVKADQRDEYEAWTDENNAWVNETLHYQVSDPHFYGRMGWNYETHASIHSDWGDVPYNSTRDMMPDWQNYPCVPISYHPYNWDALSRSDPTSHLVAIENQQAVLSEAIMLPDESNPIEMEEYESYKEFAEDYVKPGENPGEPVSDITYPIVDSMVSVCPPENSNCNQQGKTVGMALVTILWQQMVKNILPLGSDGVVVVFTNPCNPSFTYQINGPTAMYLGRGDHHEMKQKYEALKLDSPLFDSHLLSIKQRSSYTGLPLNEDYCPFRIIVYPSSILEESYVTNNAVLFSVIAGLIFLFTSIVFLTYDFMVERRQKKVLHTATRSSAIVSSLFPSNVRDRIFAEQDATDQLEKPNKGKNKIIDFLKNDDDDDDADDKYHQQKVASKPVADLFPEATVMFADIAGFTAWSSTRDPAQVFTLLETLYGAFDEIARRRQVFKVETIGDSYMAVCGVPTECKNHATVMAKFSDECRFKMNQLTKSLESTLGAGTSNLKLRFGLNSGPVTAGVLRGERCRFQLFGDTVNTAARMESNGLPDKIQVSQTTADQLIRHGKSHWLTERPDLIEAKGKGLVKAFWVEPVHRIESTYSGSNDCAQADSGDRDISPSSDLPIDRVAI